MFILLAIPSNAHCTLLAQLPVSQLKTPFLIAQFVLPQNRLPYKSLGVEIETDWPLFKSQPPLFGKFFEKDGLTLENPINPAQTGNEHLLIVVKTTPFGS